MNDTHTILIVDDNEGVRTFLQALCADNDYASLGAADGQEGVEAAEKHKPDLILMDASMPKLNGFEAIRAIRSREPVKHIPIIMLTGELKSKENMFEGIEAGADDFLSKPIENRELLLRIRNNLRVKDYYDLLEHYNTDLAEQVRERTLELEKANTDLGQSYRETIHRLTLVAEYRDEGTGAHIMRIGCYAKELATKMGFDKTFVEQIFYAAPMHDIGKIGVPDSILLKQSGLSLDEWEVMKGHTTIGEMMLQDSTGPYLITAAKITASHHERWDGGGYPAGLRGEEIPVEGRIVNIVDQYDALRSARPYKPALDHRQVVDIITRGDGRTLPQHFDPDVLSAFAENSERFNELFNKKPL
ncbi:MAG: response regulator [Spirochaetia bacterium]|nr:response regulator [Spirochaetia bacterium]